MHPLRLRRPLGAVPFPIEGGATTRAKMKSDAVTAVGVALVDLPLAIEPHSLFGIRRTEMKCSAGTALARLTVAQVNSIRFTSGNYSKRAAVALPGSFHQPPPSRIRKKSAYWSRYWVISHVAWRDVGDVRCAVGMSGATRCSAT